MKAIFSRTFNFWLISKALLAVLLGISSISILMTDLLSVSEKLVNLLGVLETILLILTIIHDLTPVKMSSLKKASGVILVLFGLALIVVLLTIPASSRSSWYILGYPFGVLMILTGLFDISLARKHKPAEEEETEQKV